MTLFWGDVLKTGKKGANIEARMDRPKSVVSIIRGVTERRAYMSAVFLSSGESLSVERTCQPSSCRQENFQSFWLMRAWRTRTRTFESSLAVGAIFSQ